MKKYFLKVCSIVLVCAMMLAMLASCGGDEPGTTDPGSTENNKPNPTEELLSMDERERAIAIYGYVDDAMESCASYTMEGKGVFTGTMMDLDLDVSLSMLEKYVSSENVLQGAYSSSTAVIKMNGEQISETESLNGFYDGKMFSATVTDGVVSGLYSPISAADYVKYERSQADDTDFDPADCTMMSCVRNADNSWTATYKAFENGESLKNMLSGMEDMLDEGVSVDDVEITLSINESFTLRSMLVKVVFVVAPGATIATMPTYQMELTVKDIGSTQVEVVKFNKYTEVADLRAVLDADKAFDEYLNAESGSYMVEFENTVSYVGGKEETYEVNNVTFQNKDGKFSYAMRAESDSSTYVYYISYENGKMKTELKSGNRVVESDVNDYLEIHAKSIVGNNFNPCGFSSQMVIDMEVVDAANGVYKFTLDPDMLSGEGVSASGTLEVTIKDGKLIKSVYSSNSKTTYDGVVVTVQSVVTVTFD